MAPLEIKLLVDLRIGVVAVNEELCLFKVSKRLERKVGWLGIIGGKWVRWALTSSGDGRKFLRRYHPWWQFGMGVVDDECLPKLKQPHDWILSCPPGGRVWLARICCSSRYRVRLTC